MRKIAIFASGSGSNFQSIADAVKAGRLPVEIGLLVCDQEDAYVRERAALEQIECFCFSAKNFENKVAFETEILHQLQVRNIDFIVLAGYMRLIGPTLLRAFPERIVNIHPSLLPAFPGKDAIGQAFHAGVKVSGITIHYVDEGMDTGPIIAQQAIEVKPEDTRETLQHRIQQVEHSLYPQVLQQLFRTKGEEI
jgi:phosphoribosylglycinamide formyltransferase-1